MTEQTDRIRQRLDVVTPHDRLSSLLFEDFRQQMKDAEGVLGQHDPHADPLFPKGRRCKWCLPSNMAWPCPDARRAQDRLDRLDALTALMIGES